MIKAKFISATCTFDGTTVETKNVIAVTSKPELDITENSGFQKYKLLQVLIFLAKQENMYSLVKTI